VSNGEIARDRAQAETDRRYVCVVEIPKGSRNKYEYDPELGGIKFDRLLMSAATYPRTTAISATPSPRTATRWMRWCASPSRPFPGA